jgi:hypothetical protein
MNDDESFTESDTIPDHPVKTDNPFEAIGCDACPIGLGQLDLQVWEAPGPACPRCSHSAAVQIKECGAVGFGACLAAIPGSVHPALLLPLATTLMGSNHKGGPHRCESD